MAVSELDRLRIDAKRKSGLMNVLLAALSSEKAFDILKEVGYDITPQDVVEYEKRYVGHS